VFTKSGVIHPFTIICRNPEKQTNNNNNMYYIDKLGNIQPLNEV
jgi:hypothetical protein